MQKFPINRLIKAKTGLAACHFHIDGKKSSHPDNTALTAEHSSHTLPTILPGEVRASDPCEQEAARKKAEYLPKLQSFFPREDLKPLSCEAL